MAQLTRKDLLTALELMNERIGRLEVWMNKINSVIMGASIREQKKLQAQNADSQTPTAPPRPPSAVAARVRNHRVKRKTRRAPGR